jgi:hypothetical protein
MSILIRGLTRCPLCGATVTADEEAVLLPAFVWNELDPLTVFNDAAMHKACFEADPRREMVERIVAELESRTGPGKRRCVVCQREITNPDDYILLPRLVDSDTHALHPYNYTHLHKSHVSSWHDYDKVVFLLRDLADGWKGSSLIWLIRELEAARAGS